MGRPQLTSNIDKLIFVDSDVFVALATQDDSNHIKAVKIYEELLTQPVKFITSNYVFSETTTVISLRVGHKEAITFIENLKTDDSDFEIKWVDAELETLAITIFKKQSSKNVSFVDCTNMAFLTQLHADAIFSFDETYKKNGFKIVEIN